MDCWKGEWLYYNYATGSFYTNKLCSRLYSTEINNNNNNNKQLLTRRMSAVSGRIAGAGSRDTVKR